MYNRTSNQFCGNRSVGSLFYPYRVDFLHCIFFPCAYCVCIHKVVHAISKFFTINAFLNILSFKSRSETHGQLSLVQIVRNQQQMMLTEQLGQGWQSDGAASLKNAIFFGKETLCQSYVRFLHHMKEKTKEIFVTWIQHPPIEPLTSLCVQRSEIDVKIWTNLVVLYNIV